MGSGTELHKPLSQNVIRNFSKKCQIKTVELINKKRRQLGREKRDGLKCISIQIPSDMYMNMSVFPVKLLT